MQCQGGAIPLLTCCSAPRPISSTPAAWRPGRRAASRSASSSSPGTAGTAPRGHCSSPATAGCAAVRKALDTTTGTPLPQVRAQQPLLSSHVPPFLLHSHLGCPSPGKAQEGSSRRPLHPSDMCWDLASRQGSLATPVLLLDQPRPRWCRSAPPSPVWAAGYTMPKGGLLPSGLGISLGNEQRGWE